MSEEKPEPKATSDVVLLHSATDDGKGVRVLRARQGRLEAGEVRALREGTPITDGEVVKLTPRPESPRLCDVEVAVRVEGPARTTLGPAQIATESYRTNWDRIFGERPGSESKLLN